MSSWPRQEARRSGRAMVATAHPLATQAGISTLRGGGNAVDAAVAAGAVMAVVDPALGQVGGDCFMLIYQAASQSVVALNGSGAAPYSAERAEYVARGGVPEHGLHAATVPGVVDCWEQAVTHFGSQPLASVLGDAIALAQDGFPLSQRTARGLANAESIIAKFPTTQRVFAPSGSLLRTGDRLVQRELGASLAAIAQEGATAFYRGDLTQRMLRFAAEQGAPFSARDFSEHRTLQLEPVTTTYRGTTICEQPPVSQGMVVLLALNTLEHFDLAAFGAGTAETVHLQVEAHKLAMADRLTYLGDPRFVKVPVAELLSPEHGRRQADRVDARHAQQVVAPVPEMSDTTYLCVADTAGNAVSYIHSLMGGFGCGQILGDTGILFNNRMRGFSLDEESPNVLVPGKRPVHSLNSYLVLRDGQPRFVGGTPGLYWQVQTNLQVLCNLIDFGMDPQDAVDAPRWLMGAATALEQTQLALEDRFPSATVEGLEAKSHAVAVRAPWSAGGSVQLIHLDPSRRLLEGASDPRPGTGTVLGF